MKQTQIAILISISLLFIIFAIGKIRPYYIILTQHAGISPFQLLLNRPEPDSKAGITTLLLLGIPDEDNEGPNLTDSIIILSVNTNTSTITSVGLPRDIWSENLQDKINTAYAYGEERKKGGGITMAKNEISNIIGQPVHYAAVVRFSTFADVIDALGGIEVVVERSFTDSEYPIKGKENDECFGLDDLSCRYKTVSFTAGLTKMNGDQALEFVRSRHAEGVEGSDFARSRRQQLVLEALQKKMILVAKQGNLKDMKTLYSIIDSQIMRDISNQEAAVLAKKIAVSPSLTVANKQIPEETFTVPQTEDYNGKYVLIPVTENALKQYISCSLGEDGSSCKILEE